MKFHLTLRLSNPTTHRREEFCSQNFKDLIGALHARFYFGYYANEGCQLLTRNVFPREASLLIAISSDKGVSGSFAILCETRVAKHPVLSHPHPSLWIKPLCLLATKLFNNWTECGCDKMEKQASWNFNECVIECLFSARCNWNFKSVSNKEDNCVWECCDVHWNGIVMLDTTMYVYTHTRKWNYKAHIEWTWRLQCHLSKGHPQQKTGLMHAGQGWTNHASCCCGYNRCSAAATPQLGTGALACLRHLKSNARDMCSMCLDELSIVHAQWASPPPKIGTTAVCEGFWMCSGGVGRTGGNKKKAPKGEEPLESKTGEAPLSARCN